MTSKKILFLKTVSKDGLAYSGFQWPLKVGAVVTAHDFQPTPSCGHGLHGLPWGEGAGDLLNWDDDAKWIVFSALEKECVLFDGKGKCKTATICHVGSRLSAADYLRKHGKPNAIIVGGTASAGVGGTASAGDGGTASAGDGGTASAGDGGTASAGYRGTASAGVGGTASAGDGGIICIHWYDGQRIRIATGYIGEDRLLPNVAYQFDGMGKKFIRKV